MTPEAQQAQRRAIADAMGHKDADFLKWHDGMYEAQLLGVGVTGLLAYLVFLN